MQKKCENCGEYFECNAHNIASCQCKKVNLEAKQLLEITKKFSDCICHKCLTAFSVNEKIGQ